MTKTKSPTPRLRLLIGEATALGPGKAGLIEAIENSGSISAAARRMGMSYRRAWNLVDGMNKDFKKIIVKTNAGGKGGGGAEITPTGREVLDLYREIERKAMKSVELEIKKFSVYLRTKSP